MTSLDRYFRDPAIAATCFVILDFVICSGPCPTRGLLRKRCNSVLFH